MKTTERPYFPSHPSQGPQGFKGLKLQLESKKEENTVRRTTIQQNATEIITLKAEDCSPHELVARILTTFAERLTAENKNLKVHVEYLKQQPKV